MAEGRVGRHPLARGRKTGRPLRPTSLRLARAFPHPRDTKKADFTSHPLGWGSPSRQNRAQSSMNTGAGSIILRLAPASKCKCGLRNPFYDDFVFQPWLCTSPSNKGHYQLLCDRAIKTFSNPKKVGAGAKGHLADRVFATLRHSF